MVVEELDEYAKECVVEEELDEEAKECVGVEELDEEANDENVVKQIKTVDNPPPPRCQAPFENGGLCYNCPRS